jgi:hypothetical protein
MINKLQQTIFPLFLASILIIAVYVANAQITNVAKIRNTGQISTTKIWAKSGYWRDIQTAVDTVAAMGGGIVYIPEGTWNFVNKGESWRGARVACPAGVSIFGAPTERYENGSVKEWKTVLVLPWDMPSNDTVGVRTWFQFGTEGASVSKFTRFSDIKLVGYRYYNNSAKHFYVGVRIQNIIGFRVDHCHFQDVCGSGVTVDGDSNLNKPEINYMIKGIIDHCIFNNTVGIVAPWESRTLGYGVSIGRGGGWNFAYWESNSTKVLGQYTNYTVFIEDCYFSKWRHCVAVSAGAHAVVRYSTIKYDYAYGSLDLHGDSGGRAIEIYNCTIVNAVSGGGGQIYATFIRGGAGVAFNNKVGGGTYQYFIYFSNENSNSTFWINDWYVWNNTMLSGCTEITEYDPNNQITEGINYFRYASSWYTPYTYPHPLTLE